MTKLERSALILAAVVGAWLAYSAYQAWKASQ
jgi:hypothetical protein